MNPRDPEVTERRAAVWRLAEAGIPRAEIARKIGVSEARVHRDLHQHARRFGLVVPRRTAGRLRGVAPKREMVSALAAEGLTRREIAARLGISQSTVRQHIYRLRENGTPVETARETTNRETIWALYQSGVCRAEIAARLNISRECVKVSLWQSSAILGEPVRKDNSPRKRDIVASMVASGIPRKEIAARMKMTDACVRASLSRARRDTSHCRHHVKTFPAREGSAA